MSDLRKAAETAIEAFEVILKYHTNDKNGDNEAYAVSALEQLRAVLLQQEMPTKICGPNLEEVLNAAGFYKRKPLTDEQMQKLMDEEALWKFARAIEKAHGIR